LSERRVKEKIAQNNFNDNSELLLLQMQKAWQDLTDAYKQVLLSEEAKKQAEENLKMNQATYDNGLSNITDLLEAQAMLQQVRDQLTDAKASYRSQLVLYLQITGR
jgi:outer membrane protein TolC